MTKAMWRQAKNMWRRNELRRHMFLARPLSSQHQNVMKVTPERGANWTFVTLQ